MRTECSQQLHSRLRGPLANHQRSTLQAAVAEYHNDGLKVDAASKQAQTSLFTPITTPILRSVNFMQAANVFKERNRYEIENESKKAEVHTLKATP